MLFNQRVLKHARAIKKKQIANENKSSISQTREKGVMLNYGSEGKRFLEIYGRTSVSDSAGSKPRRNSVTAHSVTHSLPAASA